MSTPRYSVCMCDASRVPHACTVPQVSQRDILNSIEREMSGDLREGFKTVGE